MSRAAEYQEAKSQVVEWDEYGQGYNAKAECVVCICGEPFPMRKNHYCPADPPDDWNPDDPYDQIREAIG